MNERPALPDRVLLPRQRPTPRLPVAKPAWPRARALGGWLAAATLLTHPAACGDSAGKPPTSDGGGDGPRDAQTEPMPDVGGPGAAGGAPIWWKRLGSALADEGRGVAVDGSSNVIVTGFFSSMSEMGGDVLISAGETDVYLLKLSPSGGHLWSKRWGGKGADEARGVAADAAGDLVCAGLFSGDADLGSGVLKSAGLADIFVSKVSSAGAPVWANRFGGPGSDEARAIAVEPGGDLVVTGFFAGTVSFGGDPLVSAGMSDAFVVKLSGSGAHVWSKRFGGPAHDYGHAVALDSGGNVVVAGEFQGGVDLGGGALTSAGAADAYLAKLSPAGEHVWSKSFGGPRADEGRGVGIDPDGSVVLTGRFSVSADFGGGARDSKGLADLFVVRFTAAGEHVWSQTYGAAADYDIGYGVAVDPSGAVALAGSFEGPVDFGGGVLTGGVSSEIVVAKFIGGGAHFWSRRFGGNKLDAGLAVAVDPVERSVLVTGFFHEAAAFGGGPIYSGGLADGFIVKLAP